MVGWLLASCSCLVPACSLPRPTQRPGRVDSSCCCSKQSERIRKHSPWDGSSLGICDQERKMPKRAVAVQSIYCLGSQAGRVGASEQCSVGSAEPPWKMNRILLLLITPLSKGVFFEESRSSFFPCLARSRRSLQTRRVTSAVDCGSVLSRLAAAPLDVPLRVVQYGPDTDPPGGAAVL